MGGVGTDLGVVAADESHSAPQHAGLDALDKGLHGAGYVHLDIARMPDSEFIHFSEETAGENAKAIVRMAVENFKNRKQGRDGPWGCCSRRKP